MITGQIQIPKAMPGYRNAEKEHLYQGKMKENNQNIKHEICVFLVDDDKFFLNGLYYYLTDSLSPKITLKIFSTAEECLNEMSRQPDIVVLDYMLSSDPSKAMDGLSALKKINHISPETFVIMLSAQDSIDVAIDTLNEGAYDYISKSETAFLRLKNMIKNLAETISENIEQEREERINKRISLFIIVLLLSLFIIGRIIH
jgi:DNA-binding NtrC family response regulator